MKQYRQGDVLIQQVAELPGDCVVERHKGRLVLAEGEVTGHAHAIRASTSKVKQYTKGTELYLEVRKPVVVEHEEHGPISLEPGIYQVRRQLEFWYDEVRRVAD